MTKLLRTVDNVIDALGGTCAAAELLGVTPAAVTNWRARKKIPGSWHLCVQRELAASGHEASDDVFSGPPVPRRRPNQRSIGMSAA
jgi:hypothetical protein